MAPDVIGNGEAATAPAAAQQPTPGSYYRDLVESAPDAVLVADQRAMSSS